jgi:molecular chaperone HtpG
MQRLMRRSGQTMPSSAPVLELNPRHPLIRALAGKAASDESALEEVAPLLLELARVQDGEAPRMPALFARRVADALVLTLSQGDASA